MLTCLLEENSVEPAILYAMTDVELLIEATWVILKVMVGFLVLFYLLMTGTHVNHMSDRLPLGQALFGVNNDVRVIINYPTNIKGIWELVDRSWKSDEVLRLDGRVRNHCTEECGWS